MKHSKSSAAAGKDQHDLHAAMSDADVQHDDVRHEEPGGADDMPMNVVLGRQLRAAREARQLDLEECGHALRLPVRVLRKLESGDYSGISERVYLRNYLHSYGACVGVAEATLTEAITRLAPAEKAPELISTGGVPRSHYLWQRYTTAATYVVLTAVIVVPLVWLGFNGGLDRGAHLESLNAAPVASQDVAASDTVEAHASSGTAATAAQGTASSRRSAEQPLMASLAPFSALDRIDDELSQAPAPVPPPAVSVPGSHVLSITLTKPSWVEVTTADGEHLQYSLLPAGAHKVYHSTQALQVSIGDTTGAEVQLDGKPVKLDAYQHEHVAHFRIALEDGHAVAQSR